MKVVEGLQVGNECLKKMHQVGPCRVGSREEGERVNEGAGLVLEATVVPTSLARSCWCQLGMWGSSCYRERVTVLVVDRLRGLT